MTQYKSIRKESIRLNTQSSVETHHMNECMEKSCAATQDKAIRKESARSNIESILAYVSKPKESVRLNTQVSLEKRHTHECI